MPLDGKNRIVLVGGAKNQHPLDDVMLKSAGHVDMFYLGAPIVATANRIVASTNMKLGAYTVAAQPDVPRNITLARSAVGTADTPGTVVITGTNVFDEVITETLTVGAHGVTVVGVKAFKTVASVVGVGWAIDAVEATADTIVVGVGALLGMPFPIVEAAQVKIGILGVAPLVPAVTAHATVERGTIDMSAGTYDGTKKAWIFASRA